MLYRRAAAIAATFFWIQGSGIFAANPGLPHVTAGPIRIELQSTVSGRTAPLDFMSANDGSGRLFILQQTGKILIFKSNSVSATPFLDVSSRLVSLNTSYDERGLLGMAFHPGFNNASSVGYHKLYTFTNEPVSGTPDFAVPAGGSADNHVVIAEWTVSSGNADIVDVSTRREILRIGHPQSNHNGGKIGFRPGDGYLYIAIGDGGGANDTESGHSTGGNGQDNTNVLGKILRIDPIDPTHTVGSPNAVSANGKYRIPANNPYVGVTGVDEIYAIGFRNPYRFSIDVPADRLVVGDVGQGSVEEVDVVDRGKNYGWRRKEGSFLFNSSNGSASVDPSPDPTLINPVAEYSHDDGSAIIGGFVYRGTAVPALIGKYVFGDLNGRLFYTDFNDGVIADHPIYELRIGLDDRPFGYTLKSFGQDEAGELYALADTTSAPTGTGGRALKIVPYMPSPALTNLSTRGNVGTGENVLIGGFIINGSAPKKVLLRAIGPSITTNGQPGGPPLPGRLANPFLELHGSDGSLITSNDDWQSAPNEQQISDTGIAPTDSHESAILTDLQPGSYTAIANGVAGGTGIGLIELYDLDQSAPANAVNISTRGNVGTGDNVLIGGFIIHGTQSRNVLIRALGPSLSSAGVSNVLQDPTVELHDQHGRLLASNDNWKTPTSNQTQVQRTGLPPSNDAEAALVASSLAPGNYTAIVAGAGGTSGVALVEVYQLP